MVGQWVYTPRTLPPRVLFPEASSSGANDEEDEFGDSDDDLEGFTSDIAATAAPPTEVTPIRERFCLQKRALNEDYGAAEVTHKCEACNMRIGVGICKGCNDFLCFECMVKPSKHGCEGLLCCECGFMACGSCSHSLMTQFMSSNQIPAAPGDCSTCPSVWGDWAGRGASLPPPTASTTRKRKTYDRFFSSFSPLPTEERPSTSRRQHQPGPEASDYLFGASETDVPMPINCVKTLLLSAERPQAVSLLPKPPNEPAVAKEETVNEEVPLCSQPEERHTSSVHGSSPGTWVRKGDEEESPLSDATPAEEPSTAGRDSDVHSPGSLSGYEPAGHVGCLTPLLGVIADSSDPSAAIAGLTPVKQSGSVPRDENTLREMDTNLASGHADAAKLWEGVVPNAMFNARRNKRVSCIVRHPSGADGSLGLLQ